MKYAIVVDGTHQAQVEILPSGNGAFTGSVSSPEYGTGQITNGHQIGQSLAGDVSLSGYTADFSATLSGNVGHGAIAGAIKYGWFIHKAFTGLEMPPAVT